MGYTRTGRRTDRSGPITDLSNQFTAKFWCETDDDDKDVELRRRFHRVDDAADAALNLMEATEKQGRRPTRFAPRPLTHATTTLTPGGPYATVAAEEARRHWKPNTKI